MISCSHIQYFMRSLVCFKLFWNLAQLFIGVAHAAEFLLILLSRAAGDLVAHIKFTVLLMPNGSDRITSYPLQELQPTKTIDDPEIKAWLALGTKTKKKGGGKKKKGKNSDIETNLFSHYYIQAFHIFSLPYWTGKKGEKTDSTDAEPMDVSTNGAAASDEWLLIVYFCLHFPSNFGTTRSLCGWLWVVPSSA